MIASVVIELDAPLLHNDHNFTRIAKHSNFKILHT